VKGGTELFSGSEMHCLLCGTKYVTPELLTTIWKLFELWK